MQKVINLLKNKTLKNISIVTIGNIVNAGFGFVTLILVSRQLGPQQFGVFTIVFAIFTLISKLGDLGSNQTAVKFISFYKAKNNTKKVNEINGFFIGLTYAFIAISLIILIPFYKQIALLFNIEQFSHLVLLAIITSVGVIMFNTYSVVLQALEKFTDYIYLYSLTTFVKFFPILWVYIFIGITLNFSIAIYLLSPLFGAVFMYLFLKTNTKINLKPNLKKSALNSITPFFYFFAIASICGAVAEQLGIFVTGAMFNTYQTGLYGAATKLSQVFTIIAGSIGTVLIPRASRYSEKTHILKFAKKSLYLGLFLSLGVIPIILFPKFFIKITSGHQFIEASTLLIILSITGAISIVKGSFSSVFYSINKPQFFAITGVLSLVFNVPLMYYLGSNFGVNGVAFSNLLTQAVFLFIAVLYYYTSTKKIA